MFSMPNQPVLRAMVLVFSMSKLTLIQKVDVRHPHTG
jgi:hypothetical protein